MNKDALIEILQRQLAVSNETIVSLKEAINSMRAEYKVTVDELKKTIANLESMLRERDGSLEKAKSQMRGLKATFLPKKSEKQEPSPQVRTEEERLEEEQRKSEERKARGNNGAKRKEHFAVETVEEDVYPNGVDLESCSEIGVRDVIRYEMVQLRFIKHIYHIHTLKKGDKVYSGKAPLAPIQNSNFDGSFIAGIAELRYLYSMPVERIVKYFGGHGFDIDKPTAHGLLAKTASLFDNLYKALQKAVKEGKYLKCDETYHTVLVKAGDDGKGSRKGYIWVIISVSTGLCYFFYDDGSRSQEVIFRELKGYKGIIQSDGLGAYKRVAEQSQGAIVRLACLQHCKRGFLDDSLKDNPDAMEVARLANSLYHNEHMHRIGKDEWTVEDNLKWRQEYAPPILRELRSKLEEIQRNQQKYPPKSLMYKAANYFLNEWDGIQAIPNYGDVSWDNNQIELVNRYVSLSRRNSLFFGSHTGAQRGCIYYSLACSCRNNGINFFEYLSDLLNRTAAIPPNSPIEVYRDLLPDKWSKSEN